MDNEPNLENAELFADGSRGIYIPQFFAEAVKREFVTGVSDWCWKQIATGPDCEHYWDAWAHICDNATINHPTLGKCYLYQDDALWIVPL